MKKTILSLILISAVFSFAQESRPKIEVHGHRGCRGVRPENTMAAFREALDSGVDVIETDMNLTSDGVIVLSHDKYINPELCLGLDRKPLKEKIPIISLTLEELKKYDCGSIKNPKFKEQIPVPGENIPALYELFEMVIKSTQTYASKVKFNLETKIVPGEPKMSPTPEAFARAVVDIVKKYNMTDRVIIQSFDWRTLSEIRKLEPKITLSQLTEGNYIEPEALALTRADILSPWYKWIVPEYVATMHKAGKKVVPWTINDPEIWEIAIKAGVDGIITDYPAELIKYLKQKGLR